MSPKIENTQFFYITCDKFKERQESMEAQWKAITDTIPLNKYIGTHYNDLGMHYLMECLNISDTSRISSHPPSLAVIKSHLGLWKRIIDRKIPYACIFEDDVSMPENLVEQMSNIFKEDIPNQWDLLYFGILKLYGVKEAPNTKWVRVIKKPFYNNGFHAYFLSLKGAKKLYSFFNQKTFEEQIDIFFRNNSDLLNLYAYEENLVNQMFSKFESERLGRFVRTEVIDEYNDKLIFAPNGMVLVDTKLERMKRLEETKQFDTTNSKSDTNITIEDNEITMMGSETNEELYEETMIDDTQDENIILKNLEVNDTDEVDKEDEEENNIDLNIIKKKLEQAQLENNEEETIEQAV